MNYPEYWNPPHIIAWRALWFIPTMFFRCLFVLSAGIMMGPNQVPYIWKRTR